MVAYPQPSTRPPDRRCAAAPIERRSVAALLIALCGCSPGVQTGRDPDAFVSIPDGASAPLQLARAKSRLGDLDVTLNGDRGPYRAFEVIARRLVGAAPEPLADAVAAIGGKLIEPRSRTARALGFVRIQLPEDVTADDAITVLRNSGTAALVERNYTTAASQLPDDPLYVAQWALPRIGAPTAWDLTTGSQAVLVAVTDSGVDLSHPDLSENLWVNPLEIAGNGIDDDHNGFVDDVHGFDFVSGDANPTDESGHGTLVAGAIGAIGNNARGVSGVAWKVSLLAVRIISGNGGNTFDAAEGIFYALENGARIINCSWVSSALPNHLAAAVNELESYGALLVAAAGNSAQNSDLTPLYPAAAGSDSIVSVAATDQQDELASFSNYGRTAVDLGAPGVAIQSTAVGGGYGAASGTSFAAPLTSGALALAWSLAPHGSAKKLRAALLGSVDVVPALAEKVATSGRLHLQRLIENFACTEGTCGCGPGYRLSGATCIDVDECVEQTHSCSAQASCINLPGSYSCRCLPGYEGDGFACADFDECSTTSGLCPVDARCDNVPGSYVCSCKAGFLGDGQICDDIDECKNGTHGCDVNASCQNTHGSYSCQCKPGYSGNGLVCADIDECSAGLDDCDANALCDNTPGGYGCSCKAGYQGDGKTCTDIDECQSGTHNCRADETCVNVVGGYTCRCSGDGCERTDRCQSGDNACHPNAVCVDLPAGGYTCRCKDGYEGNGYVCADIDECSTQAHDCDPNAACINTPGTFDCACKAGFAGNGRNCSETDECAAGLHACHAYAHCQNFQGSYSCSCKEGFLGDGLTCTDINECTTGIAQCAADATCQNKPGNFACNCKPGYAGDGSVSCREIDECADGTHDCDENASCTNTDGSFTCSCKPGYFGDGKTCADIDECAARADDCAADATCENKPGGYLCACKDGFLGDGKTCTDIDECAEDANDCDMHASCTNTRGGYTCACKVGYVGDGFDCQEATPCTDGSHDCDENATCKDLGLGSFSCSCKAGYRGDGKTCADIDECAEGSHNCDSNASCKNTSGGFECSCHAGYSGDGLTCTIDSPCDTGSHDCDANAICQDLGNGQFSCSCKAGFSGDGKTCSDIDECLTASHDCDANAICKNMAGGYECSCKTGYSGDGKTCTIDDPCDKGTHDCHVNASCKNLGGGLFRCTCKVGFVGDGKSCSDIDECQSGADNCDKNATCKNTPGSFECSCNPGYSGDGKSCSADDPCEKGTHDCHPDATCTALGGGAFSCTCKAGYSGDGKSCADIDECQSGAAHCDVHATCSNTLGSFSCVCAAGYIGNGTTCELDHPCKNGTDDCDENAICTDLPTGLHSCACKAGFSGDGKVCSDIDECQTGSHDCHANGVCKNIPGGFECACQAGYAGNGKTSCVDIDECQDGTHQCDPHASCQNTLGGYTCSCNAGYQGDGKSCQQKSPCSDLQPCDPNASCTDISGLEYRCACKAGFDGDGTTCSDIDECADPARNDCHLQAVCTNLAGSYECACKPGYLGDGRACELDTSTPCNSGQNDCHVDAICTDLTGGSYSCNCKPGYDGDGKQCSDVDECATGVHDCDAHASCQNEPGSFSCSCSAGYQGDGKTCADVDECGAGTHDCDAQASCQNEPGSFSCSCNAGYQGDGRTCVKIPAFVRQIAAGGGRTCALMLDGGVRCWGWGIYGALGTGDTKDIGDNEPAEVVSDIWLAKAATQVSSGPVHSCAILEDGSLSCWGRNRHGALGYGHTNNIGDDEPVASAGLVDIGGVVKHVAAGGEHTCALLEGGAVRCWGLAVDGQLGYGNTDAIGDDESVRSAGDVALGEAATAVVAGRDHSCALLQSGAVRCWGRNLYGTLGYGHQNRIGDDETPASVPPIDLGGKAVALAAGWYHTCALLDSGAVRCWGFGGYGQLGYGNTQSVGDDETPASAGDVDVGGNVTQLACGALHTCALLDSGAVRCWGSGELGQLGQANTQTIGDDEPPSAGQEVFIVGQVSAISAGSYHSCALLQSGRVRCWGHAEHGQLGYGQPETIGDDEHPAAAGDVPLSVDFNECRDGAPGCAANAVCVNTLGSYQCVCPPGFSGDGSQSCDDIDECALGTDGCHTDATCTNQVGGYTCSCLPGFYGDGRQCVVDDKCALGTHDCDAHADCQTTGPGTYTCSCKTGFWGSGQSCDDVDECALGLDDCGSNAQCQNTIGSFECRCNEGYYGDGRTCRPNFVQDIAAGGNHSCALLASGTVRCWGLGSNGQLGYANTQPIGISNYPYQAGDIKLGARALQVVVGEYHSCALLDGGQVRCWGLGNSGQLGYGNTASIGDDEHPDSAGNVDLGGSAIQIAAGSSHTCAVLASGAVRCWGLGASGQLGYANTQNIGDNETPAAAGDVQLGKQAVSVAAGGAHTCALLIDGTVRCWGSGTYGRLGYGNTMTIGDDETPASVGDVPLGSTAIAISAGYEHTCALSSNQTVRCWGRGNRGQLGYGNSDNIGDDETPALAGDVSLGAKATRISAGYHSCAVLEDGSLRCWGDGYNGRLGAGNTATIGDDELPSSVAPLAIGGNVSAISAGLVHSCALLELGTVRCFGFGGNGQLGYANQQNIGDNEHPESAGDVKVVLVPPAPPPPPSGIDVKKALRVGSSRGDDARIFAVNGELLITYRDALTSQAMLVRRDASGTVHPAIDLGYRGAVFDVISTSSGLKAIVSNETDTRIVRGTAASGGWTEEQRYASSNLPAVCTRPPGGTFYRPQKATAEAMVGYYYHDGIGCGERSRHVSETTSGVWSSAHGGHLGLSTGATYQASRLLSGSSQGVFASDDGGTSFAEVASTTGANNTRVIAHQLARLADGTVVALYNYLWGSGYRAELLSSSDGGNSWSRSVVLQKSEPITDLLAADGTSLAMVYQDGGQPQLIVSEDQGIRWSSDAPLLLPGGAHAVVAGQSVWVLVAMQYNRDLYLIEAAF